MGDFFFNLFSLEFVPPWGLPHPYRKLWTAFSLSVFPDISRAAVFSFLGFYPSCLLWEHNDHRPAELPCPLAGDPSAEWDIIPSPSVPTMLRPGGAHYWLGDGAGGPRLLGGFGKL